MHLKGTTKPKIFQNQWDDKFEACRLSHYFSTGTYNMYTWPQALYSYNALMEIPSEGIRCIIILLTDLGHGFDWDHDIG